MSKHFVIQLSDCHIKKDKTSLVANVNPFQRLSQIIQEVRKEKPELVILTGDIADEGSADAYIAIQELLKPLNCKIAYLPGNHDDISNMEKYLLGENIINNRVINLANWRLILLNSKLENETFGILSHDELAFLDYQLNQFSSQNVAIFLHHQPIKVNSGFIDQVMLLNHQDFLSLIEIYPQVRAVFFGHVHQEFAAKHKNIAYYACPSTCVQFASGEDQLKYDPNLIGYRKIIFEDDKITSEVTWLQPVT